MTEFISKAKEQILLRALMIMYALLFTFAALASSLLASLIGTTWVDLDTQGKWMIVLAVFVNWATVMLAFVNRQATRLQSGTLPIGSDDTQLLSEKGR